MKLKQLPDNFTTEDWVNFFLRLCKEKKLIKVPFHSTGFINRSLDKFREEYLDKYMIAEVLQSLLDSDYQKAVGLTPRLLTFGAFERELYNYPQGYPWQYVFFEKVCNIEAEHEYFRKWIRVYLDAHFAPSTAPPMVGTSEFESWESVQLKAIEKLDKGVNGLVQRYLETGWYSYV